MYRAFVHEAVVALEPGGDPRAPGAAVTVELCGGWEHRPPCPLAPHHTAHEPADGPDGYRLRILFAAEPDAEAEVRARITTALGRGGLTGPDGVRTRWRLLAEGPGTPGPEEAEHALRLAGS
ncbi:hypothetical protein [Kitasatospora sp. DSM 101779]|uniref:hypothetical protein n=1 Tax=Kitasatospora sp. DSM 101779 TaxID=2853165 RepID=UPI0021D87D99|nr:hypothetical protein [Kitasatospora sp. DSM 101779]MCU7826347.1 hypothetical protein [Kitasatospora sp. DSM 101779]